MSLIPKGEDALDSTLRSFLFFSCLAVTRLPKAPIFQVSWEIKDCAGPSLTSQPFYILGARSWGHKGPPSSTLARPIWRRRENRMSPKFGKVSKGLGKGSGGVGGGRCRQGERGALPVDGRRESRLAPPPRGAQLPALPSSALTLSPRISPRCSCRRRLTSRMRLLWSSIALTFSASARRRQRISSSLLHCSSSSSDTLDRSSTAAAADGPAEVGGQLSAADAPPAAFDMVSARWQVPVGGKRKATPEDAGAAGPPPPTPLCAPASQLHRPGAAGLGRQGSHWTAILPRHLRARARAPPGPGSHPRAAAKAHPDSAQVHGEGRREAGAARGDTGEPHPGSPALSAALI